MNYNGHQLIVMILIYYALTSSPFLNVNTLSFKTEFVFPFP